jgi:predicted nucleotidyltransferase
MDFTKYIRKLNIKHIPFKKEIGSLFDLYYPKKSDISLTQRKALQEIIDNTNTIKKYLKPLEDMGLSFSISIVGGAVRDFVLGKADIINDHDFVISLKEPESHFPQFEPKNLHVFFDENEILKIKEEFKKYTFINPIEHQSYNKFIWPLLFDKVMLASKNNYKLFNLANIQEVKDKHVNYLIINKAIHSLYKIKNINNKDMDIIISKYNEDGFQYIRSFDFELCKGSVDLSFIGNSSQDEVMNKFIDNMYLMPGMLRDIHNKTLSIQAARFEFEHLQYFLNKHYPKLKAKYPEYQINTIMAPHSQHRDSENLVLKLQLENERPNSDMIHTKRIKI